MSGVAERYPGYKRKTALFTLIFFGLWVLYVLLMPNTGKTAGLGVPIGEAAPDFELQTIEGKSYRLSDLKGKPVMINFWATWCPPCRAEMPAMQEAFKEFEAEGFTILAVNLNESDVAIKSFIDRYGLTFPIVVDKQDKVSKAYDIVPLPTSYFVDRDGIVQGKWTGEIRKEQLRTLIKKIL